MARISNGVVGALNLLTLLASLAAIGVALWLRLRGGTTECERVLFPLPLSLGAATLVASALGLVGACFRRRAFLWAYLALLFVVIVAAVALTVAVLVVTHRGAVGRKLQLPGHIKEHRLKDFSHWLAKRVLEWKNWVVIESCLKESGACRSAAGVAASPTDVDFYEKLSPIQSGCCKPPRYCKFMYVNTTTWVSPSFAGAASSPPDCSAWSNDEDKLCYACDSCKTGVIMTLKGGWRKLTVANIALLCFLIVVYAITCCALRNDEHLRQRSVCALIKRVDNP
ncbi:tetraspanin-8-like [Curcuma longa]|uniref:tetraspanin-8-like n=1 Tax=Curcuma longa TaxID=136217 RepID=UPI003D9E4840